MHRDKFFSSTCGSVRIKYMENGIVIKERSYPKTIEGQKAQFEERNEWKKNGSSHTFKIN